MDVATLVLGVDSRGVNDATRAMEGMSQVGRGLEGIVQKMAAAWASWKVIQYAKEAATLAARYETLGVVMGVVGNNAGYTRSQMEGYAASLQKAGISMVESRNSLSVMAQSHIDLSKATALGRLAQDAAVVGNMNSSEAFQRMILGIQTGQTETLRTIGINVQFDQSYKDLARSLGKTVAELSEQEKTQARTNVVLSKAVDLNGAYEASMGTAGKQLLSMTRYAEDLQVIIGALFSDAFGVVIQAINQGLADTKKWLDQNGESARTFNAMLGLAAKNFVGLVTDVLGLASDMGKVNDELSIAEILAGGLALSMAVIRDVVMATIGLIQTLMGGIEVIISGALLGVQKILNLLTGFEAPKWLSDLWDHGTSWTSGGVKKMTTSATAELYNPGGNIATEVQTEQDKKNKDAKSERTRIELGEYNRLIEWGTGVLEKNTKAHTESAKAIKAVQDERAKAMAESNKNVALALRDAGPDGVNAQLDAMQKEIDLEKELVGWLHEGTLAIQAQRAAQEKAAQVAKERLMNEGAQLTGQMMTPGEKRNAEMERTEALLKGGAIGWETYTRKMAELEMQGSTLLQSLHYGLEGMGNDAADAFGRWVAGMDGAALSFRKMTQQMIADMARMAAQKGFQELLGYAFSGWSGVGTAPGGAARIDYGTGSPSSGGPLNFGPIPEISQGGASGQGLELLAMKAPSAPQGGATITSQIIVNVAQDGTASTKGTSSDGNAMARAIQQSVEPLVIQTIQKLQRPGAMLNPMGSRS